MKKIINKESPKMPTNKEIQREALKKSIEEKKKAVNEKLTIRK